MRYAILLLLFTLAGCSSFEYRVYDKSTQNAAGNALVLAYSRDNPESADACIADENGRFSMGYKPDIMLVGKPGYAISAIGKYSPCDIYLENMEEAKKRLKFRKEHIKFYANFDENTILFPTFLLNKLPANSPCYKDWHSYSQYLKNQTAKH